MNPTLTGAGVGVLGPTVPGMSPSGAMVSRALPLLPAVVLFAGVNTFNEDVYSRASPLATLDEVVGPGQALLMTVVLFGLAHWLYGSPPGVVGCLMTGLLAWLMGKSILETKGLGWAWFIHVVRQSRYPPADARMTVCEYEDGHLALVYRGQAMRFREIPAPRPIVATPKPAGVHPPAPQRRPAPANHPWRQRYDRLHDRVSPGESIPGHFRPRGANV